MEEILKNISSNDLEKLRMLLSIMPGNEVKEIVTLRVFRDEYLNFILNNKSKSYYISVKLAFSHMITFFGAQFPIHNLLQKESENFLIHLQKKVSKGYIVYYCNLKAALNKAKDWDYIKENYFTKVKLPKRQKLAPGFINSNQLLAVSNQIKNDVVKEVVVFAFYTGLRLNEIVNLRWSNIDLQNKIITVGDENFITKGRKQRFIPMSDEVLETLLRIKNAECRVQNEKENIKIRLIELARDASTAHSIKKEFVFCKENGEKFTGNYFSKRFKKACKDAGLDNSLHFHSLRHSFASNLVQKGAPLYTIKELLGHSSISTTEIYSHLDMGTLREAVKKLDTGCKMLDTGEKQKNELKIFRINTGEVK